MLDLDVRVGHSHHDPCLCILPFLHSSLFTPSSFLTLHSSLFLLFPLTEVEVIDGDYAGGIEAAYDRVSKSDGKKNSS